MSESRMARRGRKSGRKIGRPSGAGRVAAASHRPRPWLIPLVASVAILVVLASSGLAVVALQSGSANAALGSGAGGSSLLPKASITASDGVGGETTASALTSGTLDIEVPDVVGKSLASAELILQTAGFVTITRVASRSIAGVPGDQVLDQTPVRGTRLQAGDTVLVTYNPVAGAFTDESLTSQPIVVIDAGHQAKADLSLEPIGPGAATMKEKVKGGATGVVTRIPEYKQTLAISLRLRDRLEARGVKVIMVRTTNEVNIANSQRAIIGNKAGAALTIRIHCDSSADSRVKGISTLVPAGNEWCRPIEASSRLAAEIIESSVVASTGALRRGLFGRSDMSGFNWSTVPTIIVECGFMSNAAEDRLLATPEYQDKLAAGLATGVLEYIGK